MIRWKVPCESSPASAGLKLTAEALPKSAICRAGLMREPQCFSTCLSVPGFAWLDRKDSKQASACWSVSVGGLPLEPYPRIYDPVKGPMQRSLTLTPTPAATLSVLPSGSHSALRENRRYSLASAGLENATAVVVSRNRSLMCSESEQRRSVARALWHAMVWHASRVSGEIFQKTYCIQLDELAKWSGVMPRVEFLRQKIQKPTPGT